MQDFKAEQSVLSLQVLSSPECNVIRGSMIQSVRAETLVVGDVVQLSTGDIVPADLRLFQSLNLSTDEALLTGESLPSSKHAEVVLPLSKADIAIGDRVNMVYSASIVARGRGLGLVTATGMNTEVGKIAALLNAKKQSTSSTPFVVRFAKRFWYGVKSALGLIGSPLQVSLSKFALLLFALAILLAIIVFSTAGWDVSDEVLIYGLCVAIAVIPESLIAVLTLTIAVGTQTMAKSNIIVRRLSSLEAIGGATNICSDKTGTLTLGKMILKRAIIAGGGNIRVHDTSDPFNPHSGTVEATLPTEQGKRSAEFATFLEIAALCNLAEVSSAGVTNESSSTLPTQSAWSALGEPTEIALQVFATRFQHGKPQALAQTQRKLITEFPFDSTIKRMAVAYTGTPNTTDIFVKGATEALLPLLSCSDQTRHDILAEAEAMALKGLRVLCLASKSVDSSIDLTERSNAECDLKYAGLVGIYDPPRAETAEAVRTCQSAGIRVHMLTGDHIGTAAAIAAEVGITKSVKAGRGEVMAGGDFDKMTEAQIDALTELPLVLARCSPTTKVRMVQALHRRRAFAIMTGDGINDSPALVAATVGIALSSGTSVAIEAADIVLMRSDLLDVVAALHLSRSIFATIRRNLIWACVYNVLGIPLAMGLFLPFGLHLHPMMAGAMMAFSSVSVVTSSLALKWWVRPAESLMPGEAVEHDSVWSSAWNTVGGAFERVGSVFRGGRGRHVGYDQLPVEMHEAV